MAPDATVAGRGDGSAIAKPLMLPTMAHGTAAAIAPGYHLCAGPSDQHAIAGIRHRCEDARRAGATPSPRRAPPTARYGVPKGARKKERTPQERTTRTPAAPARAASNRPARARELDGTPRLVP